MSDWNNKTEKIINEYLDKIDTENQLRLTEIKNRLNEKGLKGIDIEEIFENDFLFKAVHFSKNRGNEINQIILNNYIQ